MLIEFSFENMFSFKEWTTFSMKASKDDSLEENFADVGKDRILKSTAIYGPNASGKTNMFKILFNVVDMIRMSSMGNIEELPIVPFKFDDESIKKPSKFEIRFYVNEIKYVYGFTADKDNVYEEYLKYFPNGRVTNIFTRKNINTYVFPAEDKGLLNSLKNRNDNRKFFIATAAVWGYKLAKPAFDYLVNGIGVIIEKNVGRYALSRYINDESVSKFAMKILKKADINISDFEVKQVDSTREDGRSVKRAIIITKHRVNGKEYELLLEEESRGTNFIFVLIPVIKDVLDNGKTFLIDEFDSSLHPVLTRMIVNMFNNPRVNRNNAQLIFNTHDTELLDLELMRRDQYWMVDKNPDTGESEIYALDDFPVRKTENVEKGYLNGRYGAIPYITSDMEEFY